MKIVFALVLALTCASPAISRADDIHMSDVAELVPVTVCAFDVGAKFRPVVDLDTATVSEQLAKAIADQCPRTALDAALAQLSTSMSAENAGYMRGVLRWQIWQAATHGYREANPLTTQVFSAGQGPFLADDIMYARVPGLAADEIIDVQSSTLPRASEREIWNRTTLLGQIDGLTYSRDLNGEGTIGWGKSGGRHFEVDCAIYIASGICKIDAQSISGRSNDDAFTAVFDSNTGAPLQVCAWIFHGDDTSVDTRVALEDAALDIDGRKVELDRRTGCIDDGDGRLIDEIARAHVITSRHRYPNSARAGVHATLGVGFSTARKLLAQLISARRPGPDRARLERLFGEAEKLAPHTRDEFIFASDAWSMAADCLAAAGAPEVDCAHELAYARGDWPDPDSNVERITMYHEAIGFYGPTQIDDPGILDKQESLETGWREPKYAKYIAALNVEAERRRRGIRPARLLSLDQSTERNARLGGKLARTGFVGPLAYAYALSGATATATVERHYLTVEDPKPIRIACERGATPSCIIRLSFDAASGGFQIRTDGDLWNSRLCVGAASVSAGPLVIAGGQGWPAALDATNCASRFDSGSIIAWGGGIVLVAGEPGRRRQIAGANAWDLALAFDLARLLSAKLNAH